MLAALAWPSGGAQALRVLNQFNQLNLLTKKQNSRATNDPYPHAPIFDRDCILQFTEWNNLNLPKGLTTFYRIKSRLSTDFRPFCLFF